MQTGSSPRTWGILVLECKLDIGIRFIPTHVGHTRTHAPPTRPRPVHPHARGAYLHHSAENLPVFGSSPRTWGIQEPIIMGMGSHRFIPTHVGHTRGGRTGHPEASVHPHARGAYPSAGPPVMPKARFIPTHVGHTRDSQGGTTDTPVHPHARGAYGSRGTAGYCKNGSSPRTWGILIEARIRQALERFIPTHVGHTLYRRMEKSYFPVHPHARGAYFVLVDRHFPTAWFIPTHVGHTEGHQGQICRLAVHPHARGAYWLAGNGGERANGSSPRTWGIHVSLQSHDL